MRTHDGMIFNSLRNVVLACLAIVASLLAALFDILREELKEPAQTSAALTP